MALQWILSPSKLLERVVHQLLRRNGPNGGENDHPLLKNFSTLQSYATSHAKYPAIQTLYHAHAHTDKLKAIADLPLLVFVHGLGGSLPQFAPLLGTFVNIAPVFAIELPGHGESQYAPQNYEAYTFEALVDLWKTAIVEICVKHSHHKVVLICHSLGSSIGASLATNTNDIGFQVIGLTAICPKATPPTQSQVRSYRRLLLLPDLVLNVLRWFDRLGDESSNSVKRFVGEAAGPELKRMQLKYNKQFKTPVWKRTSMGLLPSYDRNGIARGGLPGREMWENVTVPLLLIAGDDDKVTKPEEVFNIISFIQGRSSHSRPDSFPRPLENPDDDGRQGESTKLESRPRASDQQYGVHPTILTEHKSKHSRPLKSVILPSPASHALMYDHTTYRTVAGLIEDFLSRHVSTSLELGWQLQQLTTSGKWDVKNLEKWRRVLPVSGPIDNGFFRALKTLREQDDIHCPAEFLKRWSPSYKSSSADVSTTLAKARNGRDKIYAIIDISHDSPVYDTKAISRGGIQYHKFPTVSKVPPTVIEVKDFIALVDRLRSEIESQYSSSTTDITNTHQAKSSSSRDNQNHNNDSSQTKDSNDLPAIGVHCHYGYNRTGFFIICYMIERRGWRVQDAIEEFARAKPPGIRHDHFIDTLFVRYCVGLRRSSTSTSLNLNLDSA